MSNKLSSATKRLMGGTPDGEQDQSLNLLVRVAGSLSPELEAAIRNWGGQVRTRAGDVVSMSLPLRHVNDLAELDSVIYVEAAEPLYPESPNQLTGE